MTVASRSLAWEESRRKVGDSSKPVETKKKKTTAKKKKT